jgi:hypothetical protein
MRWFAVITCLFLFGCVTNSGVVPNGSNVYKVYRQASAESPAATTLKADALKEAGKYCLGRGKTLKVLHASETRPAYLFRKFQRVDIRFTCVEKAAK